MMIRDDDEDSLTDEEELDAGLPSNHRKSGRAANRNATQMREGIMKHFLTKMEDKALLPPTNRTSKSQGDRRTIKIFISYSWHCRKDAVHEMAMFLMQQQDLNVWIDMESMSGHTYESMAKGIDEADVVLVFFSKDYADSSNCRREIEYAANKNKPIFPIRVQEGFRPDGWLLFIFRAQLRIDFCEKDHFDEVASKICAHIRSSVDGAALNNKSGTTHASQGGAQQATITTSNFKLVGVPHFSKSKYFNRPDDESRILQEIQAVSANVDDGCLVISGDGGVGKTTLVARLLTNSQNHSFFARECNLNRVLWINCFDWRESFDEKVFTDKILSLAQEMESDADQTVSFPSLQSIQSYYSRKKQQIAYVLDDMFNCRLLQFFMEKHQNDLPMCLVVTRDAHSIVERHFNMVQKVERVEELTDEGIKQMLKLTYRLDKRLSDDQLQKLAQLCCGLPLIASLIASRIGNCEDKLEVKSEYKHLTSPQYRISNLKTQDRSFKTVSNLFAFSLDQMDASMRKLYYAFLLFNPAEPISIFDLGVLWGFNLSEDYRCGLRGVCRAFEKKSLVRRVKRLIVDDCLDDEEQQETENEENKYDDALEDRFLVHQMLYESALLKAKTDFKLNESLNEKTSLQQIRTKIIRGATLSEEECNHSGSDSSSSDLAVILRTMNYRRRRLFENIIEKLEPEALTELCLQKSKDTNGMAFAHYLYHFNWEGDAGNVRRSIFSITNVKAKRSYRLLHKILTKLKTASAEMTWRVISCPKQSDVTSCLLMDIMSEGTDGVGAKSLDSVLLASLLLRWHSNFEEMKLDKGILDSNDSSIAGQLLLAVFHGDANEVERLLETSDDETPVSHALITAARKGHIDIVQLLDKKFPNLLQTARHPTSGLTPLNAAAANGHLNVVRCVCDKNPQLLKNLPCSNSPIEGAAKNGHLNCLQYFLEKNPDFVKAVDSAGHNCLMAASIVGYIDCIKYLAETFPELIDAKDRELGCTAAGFAALNGHIETVEYLYSKHSKPEDFGIILSMAAAYGQIEVVQYILSKNPEVAGLVSLKVGEVTPILLAAGNGHTKVVEELSRYSDLYVNVPGQPGRMITALMMASTGGHLETAKLVHFKKPELLKVKGNRGQTALSLAKDVGQSELIKFLEEEEKSAPT